LLLGGGYGRTGVAIAKQVSSAGISSEGHSTVVVSAASGGGDGEASGVGASGVNVSTIPPKILVQAI